MKNLYFDDFEDFSCVIADKFDRLDKENFEDIAVIAKPDEIKEIFKELVCIGYDICNITYERIDWDGYDDEYILSMNHDGIWLEKFKREDGKYLTDESTITYILDNCSSKVIPCCKGKNVFEVNVDVDDEYYACDECDYCNSCDFRDENDEDDFTVDGERVSKEEFDEYTSHFRHNEKPATTSKSIYKINNKECSKEEFDEKYEEFEKMYIDNIRDMLLNYCEFMDSVNDWRSRFLRW